MIELKSLGLSLLGCSDFTVKILEGVVSDFSIADLKVITVRNDEK